MKYLILFLTILLSTQVHAYRRGYRGYGYSSSPGGDWSCYGYRRQNCTSRYGDRSYDRGFDYNDDYMSFGYGARYRGPSRRFNRGRRGRMGRNFRPFRRSRRRGRR